MKEWILSSGLGFRVYELGFRFTQTPQKVGTRMAQHLQQAISLRTFGV